MARVPAFTSKEAFKDITWAVKNALPKSIQVAPIREAVAKFEGFDSANEYMDFLDRAEIKSCKALDQEDWVHPGAREFAEQITLAGDVEPGFYHLEEERHSKTYRIYFYYKKNKEGANTRYFHDLPFEINTFRGAVSTVLWLNRGLGYHSYKELASSDRFSLSAPQMKPYLFGFATEADIQFAEMPNPYLEPKLRGILLECDSGGCNSLQDLAAHLFNGYDNEIHLPHLIRGTDSNFFKYALDMITWYRRYGEADSEFMDIARQVVRNKRKAAAFKEGYELARNKAQRSEYGDIVISHQEFRKWKNTLLDKIRAREIRVETNCDDDEMVKELMDGVQRYEDYVEQGDWV
jgi:hypothetical protein